MEYKQILYNGFTACNAKYNNTHSIENLVNLK